MSDENLQQEEGLMSNVPVNDQPEEQDPNETSVPHKEEEKAEDKTYENEKEEKLEKPKDKGMLGSTVDTVSYTHLTLPTICSV